MDDVDQFIMRQLGKLLLMDASNLDDPKAATKVAQGDALLEASVTGVLTWPGEPPERL